MDEGHAGEGGRVERGASEGFCRQKCFMPAAPHYRSRGEEPCERSTPTQKGFAVKQPLLCSPTYQPLPIILIL